MHNAIGTTELNQSFVAELNAAGLNIPMSFSDANTITYGPGVTEDQKAKVALIISRHNPLTAALTVYAANARFAKETSGITVSGMKIATTRESQAQIFGAASMAQLNANFKTQWKDVNGDFTLLAAAQIIQLATAVGTYIAACFDAEANITVGIKATPPTITTTTQIDTLIAQVGT